MAITKMSNREFNQDVRKAKRAAKRGPVFITDRGRPSYVLLKFEEYQRIQRKGKSIVELLAMSGGEDIEFEPPIMGKFHEHPDFS